MQMKDKDLTRRKFLASSSVTVFGSALGFGLISACRFAGSEKSRDISLNNQWDPERDGGCVVALGYDVDMPYGGNDYLYNKDLPWKGRDGLDAHGHLNDDIRNYIKANRNLLSNERV